MTAQVPTVAREGMRELWLWLRVHRMALANIHSSLASAFLLVKGSGSDRSQDPPGPSRKEVGLEMSGRHHVQSLLKGRVEEGLGAGEAWLPGSVLKKEA